MNTTHVFGGALINTSVMPIDEGTPIDPRLEPTIAAFLAMAEKAHVVGAEDLFRSVLEICLDEVDSCMDDRWIAAGGVSG
jgi:hypothetical protein